MFYIENENEPVRPIALATCVLYEQNENHYLITASHVFEDINPKKIGILIDDVFSLLHGDLRYTNDKANKFDLAVMKLASHFVKDILNQYSFLTCDMLEKNHVLTNKQEYLMVGFPVSKTKIFDKIHKREEFILLTKNVLEKQYNELGYDKKYHVIVDVKNTRNFQNTCMKAKIPDLFGLSGSGLWHINPHEYTNYFLIAIMTEWDKKNQIAIGIKIDYVSEIIKQYFES